MNEHSVVATGGLGVTTPPGASNDVILTSFSHVYFEVLDTLSLIIWGGVLLNFCAFNAMR